MQKFKVIENVFPWNSVPYDERQQEQGSRANVREYLALLTHSGLIILCANKPSDVRIAKTQIRLHVATHL